MVIEKIVLGYLQTNAYVLHVEGSSEAILIDPCEKAKDIEEALEKQGLVVKYVLLTHGHYDHIGACSYFQNRQAKIYIHKNDADKTTSPDNLNSKMYGEKIVPFKADVLLEGNETLNLAGLEIKVLSTPGHTSGSVCYFIEDSIFSGDTLFEGSYGRTDFADGSFSQIAKSLRTLLNLKKNYKVFCGHGNNTSIFYEKNNNLILNDIDL